MLFRGVVSIKSKLAFTDFSIKISVFSKDETKKLSGYFNINTEYVVKNFEQQISLSTHEIDSNTVKHNWDPTYENYYIK